VATLEDWKLKSYSVCWIIVAGDWYLGRYNER